MTDKATPPDTGGTGDMKPPVARDSDTGATPPLHGGPPMLSQAEAARVCKVSTATIRRARQAGKLPGAVQTADGWAIPVPELIAVGLMPRTTPPDTDSNRSATHATARVVDTGNTVADTPEIRELRAKLAAAEQRAAVAEAIARERGLALEDARLALRALTGPAPDTARATPPTPDTTSPQDPTAPPVSQQATGTVASAPPTADASIQQPPQFAPVAETSSVSPQGEIPHGRRRWWQRAR